MFDKISPQIAASLAAIEVKENMENGSLIELFQWALDSFEGNAEWSQDKVTECFEAVARLKSAGMQREANDLSFIVQMAAATEEDRRGLP